MKTLLRIILFFQAAFRRAVFPRNIFLIRHSEQEGQIDKSLYMTKPDYAMDLTEKGMRQAEKTGQDIGWYLKKERAIIYTSPYFRCRVTADRIQTELDSFARIIVDPRLREQEWSGSFLAEGKNMEEVQKERDGFGHFYYRFHGGESCADVYDRCSDFLQTLYRDFVTVLPRLGFPRNVIIVMHGMSIRCLLMRWLKLSVEEFEALRNPANAEPIQLVLNKKGKYELVKIFPIYDAPSHPYRLQL